VPDGDQVSQVVVVVGVMLLDKTQKTTPFNIGGTFLVWASHRAKPHSTAH